MAKTIEQIEKDVQHWTEEVARRETVYGYRSKEYMVALTMRGRKMKRLEELKRQSDEVERFLGNSKNVAMDRTYKNASLEDLIATYVHVKQERAKMPVRSSRDNKYSALTQREQLLKRKIRKALAERVQNLTDRIDALARLMSVETN